MEQFKKLVKQHKVFRNILNVPEIKTFLENTHAPNKEVRKWLDTVVRKYLINQHANIRPATEEEINASTYSNKENLSVVVLDRDFAGKLEHILDYLGTQREKLLTNVSFNDMHRLADEEMLRRIQEENVDIEIDNHEVIYTHDNGYKWVKILDEHSLKREGAMMNHCVGTYVTQDSLDKNGEVVFSLRDEKNVPHVTILYNTETQSIIELKTNSNNYLDHNDFRYFSYFQEFVSSSGIHVEEIEDNYLSEYTELKGVSYRGYYNPIKGGVQLVSSKNESQMIKEGFFDVCYNENSFNFNNLYSIINKYPSITDIYVRKVSGIPNEKFAELFNQKNRLVTPRNIHINDIVITKDANNYSYVEAFLGGLSSLKSLDINFTPKYDALIKNLNVEKVSFKFDSSPEIDIKNYSLKDLTLNFDIDTLSHNNLLETKLSSLNIKNLKLNSIGYHSIKLIEDSKFDTLSMSKINLKQLKNITASNIFLNFKQLTANQYYVYFQNIQRLSTNHVKIEDVKTKFLTLENLNDTEIYIENTVVEHLIINQFKNVKLVLKNCSIKELIIKNSCDVNYDKNTQNIENISFINSMYSEGMFTNHLTKENILCLGMPKHIIDEREAIVENGVNSKLELFNNKSYLGNNLDYVMPIYNSSKDNLFTENQLYYIVPGAVILNINRIIDTGVDYQALLSLVTMDVLGHKNAQNFLDLCRDYNYPVSVGLDNYIKNTWTLQKTKLIEDNDLEEFYTSPYLLASSRKFFKNKITENNTEEKKCLLFNKVYELLENDFKKELDAWEIVKNDKELDFSNNTFKELLEKQYYHKESVENIFNKEVQELSSENKLEYIVKYVVAAGLISDKRFLNDIMTLSCKDTIFDLSENSGNNRYHEFLKKIIDFSVSSKDENLYIDNNLKQELINITVNLEPLEQKRIRMNR